MTERLHARYELPVRVGEPVKTQGRVSTWKLIVETRPGRRHLPAQRIHVDICAIPRHDPRPMMLRNFYGVDLGTSGLIVQAQSREEILADKIIALAFRENRIKNRDLWDVSWLVQQGVILPVRLIPLKIQDHRRTPESFVSLLNERVGSLEEQPRLREDFLKEMRRFLPASICGETLENPGWWPYVCNLLREQSERAIAAVS